MKIRNLKIHADVNRYYTTLIDRTYPTLFSPLLQLEKSINMPELDNIKP